jgi:hypothetical protein
MEGRGHGLALAPIGSLLRAVTSEQEHVHPSLGKALVAGARPLGDFWGGSILTWHGAGGTRPAALALQPARGRAITSALAIRDARGVNDVSGPLPALLNLASPPCEIDQLCLPPRIDTTASALNISPAQGVGNKYGSSGG